MAEVLQLIAQILAYLWVLGAISLIAMLGALGGFVVDHFFWITIVGMTTTIVWMRTSR